MAAVTHRALLGVVAVLGAAALAGMIVLWPGATEPLPANPAQTTTTFDATLLEVVEVASVDNAFLTPGAVDVAITARLDGSGEVVEFETTDQTGSLYAPGQKVRLAAVEQQGLETTYFITDFRRATPLIVLAVLFGGAVLAFGRFQGLRALIGLALTFLIIVGFMIPALLDGRSPLAIAVVGSVLIMIITLYLSHGFTAKTTAAAVGTALALLVTGGLSVLFVESAHITGFASEEARMANLAVGGISLRGLLLAGIVVGGLGVLDDVTMAQSSTVFQLHRANPKAKFRELTTSALSVGRDHIAATVNTLFLAYAGASLPLLILFAGNPDGIGVVISSETVAVEIIRALVGSVGLIAAVPLTTALSALLALSEPPIGGGTVGPRQARPALAVATTVSAPTSDTDDDWEKRLRQAYRLPPGGRRGDDSG